MLADYQETLARLLVDAKLRALRVRAPLEFAAAISATALELDARELASLLAIDATQLERAAASLATKRRRAVEAAVPLSARLWPELGPRYLDELARTPATIASLDPGLGPSLSELADRLPHLRGALSQDPLAPPWAVDLLNLEFARACTRRDGQLRTLRCAYLVDRALEALSAGWLGVELEPHACVYLVEPGRLRWRDAGAES